MPRGKILKGRTPRGRRRAIDADGFWGQKQSVLRARRALAFRWVTVTLAAVSWLAVSNHCALGLAAIETHQAEALAAHDCCASDVPAQPKPTRDSSTPCCKTLQAVSASPGKSFDTNVTTIVSAPLDFITAIVARPRASRVAHRFLDTGPPGRLTFAESVLQRSILAHAPPFFS
jgi:hypothetical protein